MTHDRTQWQEEIERDAKLRKFLTEYPDFYEKVQELKRRIEEVRGHPINIKVIDFGDELFWGEIGQLALGRDTYYLVNKDTRDAEFARILAYIEDVDPDQYGNRVVNSSIPQDGSIRNSTIINTNIYGANDIEGAVVIDSTLANARIARGSVVFRSVIYGLTMGEMALILHVGPREPRDRQQLGPHKASRST